MRNEKELCSSNVAIEAGAKKKVKASKTAFEFYCEGGKRDKYSKKNPNCIGSSFNRPTKSPVKSSVEKKIMIFESSVKK